MTTNDLPPADQTETIFQSVEQTSGNASEKLDALISSLRDNRRAAELFEAMKMKTRHGLGLPLIVTDIDPKQTDEVERQLEDGMIEACREAGKMLLEDGNVSAGWMYLRPTGDLELTNRLLAKLPIKDDNYDDMIQILVGEGVDIARGYRAVLKQQGTCNSITMYEQTLVGRPKADRQAAAGELLDHFYEELREAVRGDIARRTAPASPDESLADMIQKRPEIMSDGGYHLDTTHISSTVQIASICDTPRQWQMAWELTQYGRRLDKSLQYPGEEPFVDFYPSYGAFYGALLGRDIDATLQLFKQRAETVDPMDYGTGAIEAYVDLLERTGRPDQAIVAATKLVPKEVPPQRIVPILLDLAGRSVGNEGYDGKIFTKEMLYQPIADFCRQRGDVLGFAAAVV